MRAIHLLPIACVALAGCNHGETGPAPSLGSAAERAGKDFIQHEEQARHVTLRGRECHTLESGFAWLKEVCTLQWSNGTSESIKLEPDPPYVVVEAHGG